MSQPFVAEIRMFGFSYAPRGWAMCRGQLLAIQQYSTLFSIIGTYYGGNGTSTFALPNLQGAAAVGVGQGPGLSDYDLGQAGGATQITLTSGEIPAHTHLFQASNAQATTNEASGNLLARGNFDDGSNLGPQAAFIAPSAAGTLVPLNPTAVAPSGFGLPHNNMMPFLAMNYCIALVGTFPARN